MEYGVQIRGGRGGMWYLVDTLNEGVEGSCRSCRWCWRNLISMLAVSGRKGVYPGVQEQVRVVDQGYCGGGSYNGRNKRGGIVGDEEGRGCRFFVGSEK